MTNERGSALVIALIAMALLAVLIMSFSQNTDIDLLISRNARIAKQSFLWSDSGIGIAQELISISEEWAGEYDNSTFEYDFGGEKVKGLLDGKIYNATGNATTVTISDNNNKKLVDIEIRFLSSVVNDGTSVIFGAGYEGVGKGAGAGGTIGRIYSIQSSGYSGSESTKKSAAIYRSVSSGK